MAAVPPSSSSPESSSDESDVEIFTDNNTDSDSTVIYDPKTYFDQQVPAQTLIRKDANDDVPNFELKRQLINLENKDYTSEETITANSQIERDSEPMDTCNVEIDDKRYATFLAEAFKSFVSRK